MVHYKSINNTTHNLNQREQYFKDIQIDEKIPHVFLQTCNRIELYWGEGSMSTDILRHLCRVASGLESGIIGERAIQGQLKTAYQEACDKYKLPAVIHKLFQTAIHAGKRVRTETKISQGATSHSQSTVDILKSKPIDLEESTVTIIGINKLTEDIIKFLTAKKSRNIYLSNRTTEKIKPLAEKYNIEALPLGDKKQFLRKTDVLICATSAPNAIIDSNDIGGDKEMLIFDLAFPCDVDKNIAMYPNIELYNLDDIEKYVQTNMTLRKEEIASAEIIIEEEIAKFKLWESMSQKICTTL